MKGTLLAPLETEERFWNDPSRGGMKVRFGTYPCTFDRERPHPVASIAGRRIARFRRHLEGGIQYHQGRGARILYVVIAMRYDQLTGRLRGNLRYSTQRFIQKLRRGGLRVEYLRVVEPNESGVKNHANLVMAVYGEVPTKHEMKDAWAAATYGTSFELESSRVQDVGQLSAYLSKFLGAYLSKTLDESGPDVDSVPEGAHSAEGASSPVGLDNRYHNATASTRVSEYVTSSRDWLPLGAEKEWKRLFRENAYFWTCDRGFVHTTLGETGPKWLAWIDRQAWAKQ